MNITLIEEYSADLISNELLEVISKQMDFINESQSIAEIKSFLKTYLTKDSNAKLLVLEEEKVVGFAFINISVGLETRGKYIWLNELHIEKEFQKQGYGMKILAYLDEYAGKNNIIKIMGLVSKENNATSFYEKYGFELDEYYLFIKATN